MKKLGGKIRNSVVVLGAIAQCLALSLPAYAEDAAPGDFVTAPAGTQLGLLYYMGSTSNSFVDTNGNNVAGSSLNTNVVLFRYVYYYDVAGMRADVNVLQPFGGLNHMSVGGTSIGTKGFTRGDLTLVGTVWPLNEPEKGLYFGIANYLTLPTGDYSATKPGLAANQWSGAIQPGFIFKIAPKWSVSLAGDITIYGNNNDGPGGATIKEDASYTALGWLNYQPNDTTTLSLGAIRNWGGAETIGDVRSAAMNSTTVRASWSEMLNPTTQLLMEAGHDVGARNTFKRNMTFTLRFAKFF